MIDLCYLSLALPERVGDRWQIRRLKVYDIVGG